MYVVTGATGHTGSRVAENLLASGKKLRVAGRNAEKLQRFVAKGAEAAIANFGDVEAFARAFDRATAAYLMIAADYRDAHFRDSQERATDAFASAVMKSGIPNVVILSSIGADKSEKTGPVVGLHNFEEKIRAVGSVNALLLRPTWFMENLLPQIEAIRMMGAMGGHMKGDLSLARIATRDIADYAARRLAALDFSGHSTRELLGPGDYTMSEMAKTAGAAIGKPELSYKTLPGMMIQMAMAQMGFASSAAKLMVEMDEAMNDGWMKPLESRTYENTTPTALEQFAEDTFAPAYQRATVKA
jgi:uncharacterized protein YbjT (DUF2867 family)